MKWTTALLLAALLTLLFGLPFQEYETAHLLPIKTLQAERTAEGVHLCSEVGEGWGEDWASAVEDLRQRASGDVFFETAEQIVFCDQTVARQAAQSGDLRPAAQVRFAREPYPQEGLSAYLGAHASALTVADLRAAYAMEVSA